MNVTHCNSCGGTNEVRAVSVKATRLVAAGPSTGVVLAKADNRTCEGDLCGDCLKIIEGMLGVELDVALSPQRLAAATA